MDVLGNVLVARAKHSAAAAKVQETQTFAAMLPVIMCGALFCCCSLTAENGCMIEQ